MKRKPGDKLKIWQLEYGVSDRELYEMAGVSQSALSHFRAGRIVSENIKQTYILKGCPARLLDNMQTEREAA